jgi:rod shape-determining protein MreD
MMNVVRFSIIIVVALLFQVTIFPAYLADSFRPDLLIIVVVYLGLRKTVRGGWCLAFLLGLVRDCFSGLYLGLAGFVYLSVYLFLKMVADFLYTGSRSLMILVVFLASVTAGLLQLLLLLLYSKADGIYASLLPALIPQALVNTLLASLLTGFLPGSPNEEGR